MPLILDVDIEHLIADRVIYFVSIFVLKMWLAPETTTRRKHS